MLYRAAELKNRIHDYRIVTPPPVGLPFDLALVKQWLAIDPTDLSQDALLTMLVNVAVQAAERFTGLTFVATTFRTSRDYFGQDWTLRRAPLIEVTSIKRLVNGLLIEVDSTTYLSNVANPAAYGHAYLVDGASWPTDYDNQQNAVQIDFMAGLVSEATLLPELIKVALLQAMADAYQNRGDCGGACEDLTRSLGAKAASILSSFRVIEI